MKSIIELLKWIQDNWASIVTILVLAFGIYARAKKFWEDWQKKTEEEKQAEFDKAVEQAKAALSDYILILVSKAELDWQSEEGKLGKIKKAQVIEQIYAKYPILEQVADKQALSEYIDFLINEALKTVRKELRPIEEVKEENNE